MDDLAFSDDDWSGTPLKQQWTGWWCPVCGNVDENHRPHMD